MVKRFKDKLLSNEVSLDDMDDFVDSWHESNSEESLSSFLGLTREEYSMYVMDVKKFSDYIQNLKKGIIGESKITDSGLIEKTNEDYVSVVLSKGSYPKKLEDKYGKGLMEQINK